jgi:hypothetical protein
MSNQTPKPMTAQVPSHADSGKDAHDEDTLHVPKGVSRGTFIFLVGLMIFLLVIWLVPGPMLGIAEGNKNPVSVRFQLPSGGTVEWRASDLVVAERSLMDAFGIDYFLAMRLGIDPSKPDRRDLARLLVLDRVALDAGIEVTNADLRAHIEQTLQFQGATSEDFKAGVRMRGLDQVTVEETIRQLLRVSRFQQLVGFAGAVPDPTKIEEQWHLENVEFAFDYATVAVADFKAEAQKSLPDDAGLEAWFKALDEGEQVEFRTEEKRKAELAIYRDTETTPATELLAAYPEKPPEGTDPTPAEELARQYYDRVSWKRFQKPAGEDGAPGGFFSFEEVRERCLAEAPVYHALQRWIDELAARKTNGETIDFAAEAEKLGLDHQAFLEPLAREAYAGEAGAGDAEIGNAVFATAPDGSIHLMPVSTSQGLVVVRTTERTEPVLPPFAEMRDKVADKWLEPKAEELAKARLASLRDGFERFEPAPVEGTAPPPKKGATHFRATSEAFAAAVQAAGLELKRRDYLNKANPTGARPLEDDEERRTLTSQANQFGLYTLEADELAEPGVSSDKSKVYLVRMAGKREVPLDNMTPAQYDRYKQTVRSRAMGEIGQKLDLDFLRKNFGLWLYQDELEAEAKAAEGQPKG